ncbi:MAG TPA: hypothetical protein VGF99_12425 [Myxococcota bacterium]
MAIDWKSRMLEAGAHTRAAATRVVEAALSSGARIADVEQFAAQQPNLAAVSALFADGFVAASTNSLAQLTPAPSSTTSSGGLRAHELRFASTTATTPWFKGIEAVLPPPLSSTGAVVVVDGERFSPADIAELLRAA